MCGGAILSGFIRPSGAAAAVKKKQKQQQHQSRRVTADALWPGLGRKQADEDFEADFREFEQGLSEDDVGAGNDDDDDVVEVPPPVKPPSEWFVFAGAAKAAPAAARSSVGENRIKVATFFFFLFLSRTIQFRTRRKRPLWGCLFNPFGSKDVEERIGTHGTKWDFH